jgi:hypothetical protein
MLVIWFLMVQWGIFMFVVNLLPELPTVDELDDLIAGASSLGADATGFAAWMPWTTFSVAVGIVLAGFLATIVIRVVRTIVKTVSFGKIDL